MMRKPSLCALSATLALFGAAAHAQEDLAMEVSQLFEGHAPSAGTVPLLIELANDGPNARGVVRLSGGPYQMDYPVELPRGARKQVLAYPRLGYEGLRATLSTDQGRLVREVRFDPSSTYGSETMLLVSDSPGEMVFLRQRSPTDSGQAARVVDAYVKPERAPTRPIGYDGITAVVFGAGAERMSAEAVRSVMLYALTGGTVVFVGGASSPVLGDRRWADLLPVQDLRVRTLPRSAVLGRLGNSPVRTQLSVTTGTPLVGATARQEGDVALVVERPFGLGKTVLLAYNPFESPLSRWPGRRRAFLASARVGGFSRSAGYLNAFSQEQGDPSVYFPGSMGGPPPAVVRRGGMPYPQPEEDPFSMTLPPARKVFLVLAGYFLVVVPLNFLVLRKLRRGELAWLTAPIISLGFAGVLFASASGLYSARLSTATRGVLVLREGMENGVFVGRTQMFFPRGGRYDLGLNGVDSLGLSGPQELYMGYRRNEDTAELDPVDVGEVKAPSMRASSLAFRQLSFRQLVPAGDWFPIEVGPREGATVRVAVTNRSPHTLSNAGVYVGARRTPIKDLRPGERASVDALATALPPSQPTFSDGSVLPNRSGSVAVAGSLEGFRPGPQIGEEIASRRRVLVAAFAEEGVKP